MRNLNKTLIASVATLALSAASAQAQSAANMLTPDVSFAQAAITGPSQGPGLGRFVTPDSSLLKPEDLGKRAHTHYHIFVPAAGSQPAVKSAANPNAGEPPFTGYYTNTPASLACIYRSVAVTNGCDPNKITAPATGGSKAIALVDAYDLPTARADLTAFSSQFGLPAGSLSVVYASGSQPGFNSGWALEAALDIEMAHAMAPNAKIYLVEATTNSFADLDAAVDKAYTLVKAAGGGEISMSYGGTEVSGDTSEEPHYNKTGVLFFASTGDSPGVEYPSSSPHVIAVGGTNTSRDMTSAAPKFGAFLEETAWALTGGGVSTVFARPAFQASIAGRFAGVTKRTVPDIAAVASNLTLVWVYRDGSWYQVYGTSVASPVSAGLANKWVPTQTTTSAELSYIYSRMGTTSYFDVSKGVCGPQAGFFASAATSSDTKQAYDLCTGVGAPRGATAW